MSNRFIETVSHGLVDVPGFQVSGVNCGVRAPTNRRLDLALIHSLFPCNAAGVFTSNAAPSATVHLNRRTLAGSGPFHGIVANSGNANAWTGDRGLDDAREMCRRAEASCNVTTDSFFVCSTGHIGFPLPMRNIRKGIQKAHSSLGTSERHGLDNARAIMTTDTREKRVTVKIPYQNSIITLSGIAKGAGMIDPNMATMLAFLATDACVPNRVLQTILKSAVNSSFNAITIDGDQSTNDTVLFLANGSSDIKINRQSPILYGQFNSAVAYVCEILANKIVSDGERTTKVVEIRVNGAQSNRKAEKVARAIGGSLLVKSSWFGNDPNWGRIVDAIGYSGSAMREDHVDMNFFECSEKKTRRSVVVLKLGKPMNRNRLIWKEIVSNPRFGIEINLGMGLGSYRLLSTDITEEYVKFNKSE